MRVLIVSATGFSLGMAPSLSGEGHSITTQLSRVVEIPKITKLFANTPPDIAVFDSQTHSVPAEWVRQRGIRVLGVSSWSSLLDTNPEYCRDLIKAIGYQIPNTEENTISCWVTCWFNGNKFIAKSLVFNYDKFMPGNIGADVTSAGYIAYFNVDKSKLVNSVLDKAEKFLRKANHRGCFSINALVDQKGEIYVKGISASMNLPFTQALYENSKRSKTDILLDVFNESADLIPFTDPYVCGILISTYPYPYAKPEVPVGIEGINLANLKHLWLMDTTRENDVWNCGQISGCFGYVTARGVSVQECTRRVYRTISNLTIEGMQYRNDIGKDVNEKMYQLKQFGLV